MNNLNNDAYRPIGLFDSGFGGLTVMREVVRLLPQENLVYLGDTAHLPYGNKSPEAVLRFALNNADFLLRKKIKLLMIPCHTACSHALDILREKLSIPVIGVIQPGLELLAQETRSGKVAILGTASTIRSGLYQSLLLRAHPTMEIHAVSCPLFVPLIEEGFYDHPAASLIAESYLGHLRGKIDAALLACTHYPLLKNVLQQTLSPAVKLIEPAENCALQARETLSKNFLLNPQKEKPAYEFYASDDPEKFRQFGKIFFGSAIEKIELKKNKKM